MSLNQRKGKENIVYLHNGLLFRCNDFMKFADKWNGSRKNHYEVGNPDTERQTCYALIYK